MGTERLETMLSCRGAMLVFVVVIFWVGVFSSVVVAQDSPKPSSGTETDTKSTEPPASSPVGDGAEPLAGERKDGAGGTGAKSFPVPDWVYDARWYYIDVPRFRNGDKSNDPPGTSPWSAAWPVCDDPSSSKISADTAHVEGTISSEFGGDIRGVMDRLGYLKELDVNTILLGGVFDKGFRSRRDPQRFYRIRSHVSQSEERPYAPEPNAGERALSGLIKEAHKQGFRVALAYPFVNDDDWRFPNSEDAAAAARGLKRWFDFDGDGDSSDAVDAVWISDPPTRFNQTEWGNVFSKKIAAINPNCVIIGSCHNCLKSEEPPFFGISLGGGRLSHWTNRKSVAKRQAPRIDLCQPESTTELMRLANHSARLRPDEKRLTQDRLALILGHFGTDSPVTFYGDEVGIMRGSGGWGSPPMWWNDLPDPKTKSADYRGDFFALVQWLHGMRAEHKPLRRGDFRLVLNDAENKIFAFARSLPGDEVILVMNYGDTKQKVMLPAGTPGQMVVAMTPMIDPSKSRLAKFTKGGYDHTKIAPLPVGGGRAFVNNEGMVRLWVAPMSIRVVLVNDKEPRRN